MHLTWCRKGLRAHQEEGNLFKNPEDGNLLKSPEEENLFKKSGGR